MTKEEAWAAFAEQYNHRLHGPSDAFKFAWEAATEAEREACAKVCEELDSASYPYVVVFPDKCAAAIRQRGKYEGR